MYFKENCKLIIKEAATRFCHFGDPPTLCGPCASTYLINEADHVTSLGALANQSQPFQMMNQCHSIAMQIQILSFLRFKTSKITEMCVHFWSLLPKSRIDYTDCVNTWWTINVIYDLSPLKDSINEHHNNSSPSEA